MGKDESESVEVYLSVMENWWKSFHFDGEMIPSIVEKPLKNLGWCYNTEDRFKSLENELLWLS